MAETSWQPLILTAQRRRERRLGSWHWHEQQTVRKALATHTHRVAQRQKKARARGEESELNNVMRQKTPHPGRQARCSGTLRRTSWTSCRSSRSSMCVWRNWGTRWWNFRRRSTRRCLSSRSSPCPTPLWTESHSVLRVVVRGGQKYGSAYDRLLFFLALALEQNAYIQVPQGRGGRDGWGGCQGFSPGQNSTALSGAVHVDIPLSISAWTSLYCFILALTWCRG